MSRREHIEKLAKSKELTESVTWLQKTIKAKRIPELPQIVHGKPTKILPRHAILASVAIVEAAKYINTQLVDFLRDDGLIHMAAFHALLKKDAHETKAVSGTIKTINSLLAGRYRVGGLSNEAVVQSLKKIGRWKRCVARYKALSKS